MTCTEVRSSPRQPSWCSITPNNRISSVRGTAMSSSSSIRSTAKTQPLRGKIKPAHLQKQAFIFGFKCTAVCDHSQIKLCRKYLNHQITSTEVSLFSKIFLSCRKLKSGEHSPLQCIAILAVWIIIWGGCGRVVRQVVL